MILKEKRICILLGLLAISPGHGLGLYGERALTPNCAMVLRKTLAYITQPRCASSHTYY